MNWFDKKDEKGVMGKVHQLFSVPIIEFKFSKHSQYPLPNFPKGETFVFGWDLIFQYIAKLTQGSYYPDW